VSRRAAEKADESFAAVARDAAAEPDPRIDGELIAAAVAGSDEALDRLLRRHESAVLRLVRLLGVASGDREDVAQEILVRVFRHLGTFKPGRSFRGWLYRISVNAVHDHRYRLSRRARRESPWTEGLDETPDAALEPGDFAIAREQRRVLEEALGGLSERERAVFVLVEMEGLERREAARTLGITSITVRRHLSRARRSLHAILVESQKKL
jgi:RNA polymerase sigma-70 factor (ECF subfamily)